jgi:hypothetical protein
MEKERRKDVYSNYKEALLAAGNPEFLPRLDYVGLLAIEVFLRQNLLLVLRSFYASYDSSYVLCNERLGVRTI